MLGSSFIHIKALRTTTTNTSTLLVVLQQPTTNLQKQAFHYDVNVTLGHNSANTAHQV